MFLVAHIEGSLCLGGKIETTFSECILFDVGDRWKILVAYIFYARVIYSVFLRHYIG